jgi:hypothetical protein
MMNILHHGAFVRHFRVHPMIADEIYNACADLVIRNLGSVLFQGMQDGLRLGMPEGLRVGRSRRFLPGRIALVTTSLFVEEIPEGPDIATAADAFLRFQVARFDGRRHGLFFGHAVGAKEASAKALVEHRSEIASRLDAALGPDELEQGLARWTGGRFLRTFGRLRPGTGRRLDARRFVGRDRTPAAGIAAWS